MMESQSSAATYRSRSRSRSRSTPAKRRSVARSRVQPAYSMTRSLGYSGECKISRSVILPIPITTTLGFSINGQNFTEGSFVYSNQYLKFVGDSTHEIPALIPQAAELAAVWERVRLDKVVLTIVGNAVDAQVPQPGTSGSTNISISGPRIVLANDYDGPNTGGSTGTLSNVLQETGAHLYHVGGNNPAVTWTVNRPKYNRLIQYTETESDYEPASGFTSTAADIPHFGTRMGLADAAQTNGCRLLVFAKFFFTLKSIH